MRVDLDPPLSTAKGREKAEGFELFLYGVLNEGEDLVGVFTRLQAVVLFF